MPFSPAPSNVGRTVAKRTEKWPYRNGTESRVAIPQRHRIAGFAAVVEGGRRCNTHHRAYNKGATEIPVPQRQENTGNAAVVA